MKSLLPLFALAFCVSASANVMEDLESLGANKSIIKRAKALDPKNKVRIVQKREVDRNKRLEVGLGMGYLSGGDPYLNTKSTTMNMDFHFTPKFTLGGRFSYFDNDLTNEARNAAELAAANPIYADDLRPDMDPAKSEYMATMAYYPVYGKINWFDSAVQQFDLYVIGGLGLIELESGNAQTWMAGTGVGIWFNKYLSSRLEVSYQAYQDQLKDRTRDMENVKFLATIGFML